MNELLNCPFCGGKATIEEVDFGYSVCCGECLGQTCGFQHEDDAIEAWNRRA